MRVGAVGKFEHQVSSANKLAIRFFIFNSRSFSSKPKIAEVVNSDYSNFMNAPDLSKISISVTLPELSFIQL